MTPYTQRILKVYSKYTLDHLLKELCAENFVDSQTQYLHLWDVKQEAYTLSLSLSLSLMIRHPDIFGVCL